MIKLGIIGTGWISDQFVEACAGTGMYQLTSVYSRTLQKAEEFGRKYMTDGEYFDDLEKFFSEGSFDTVYIASPNSLHFAQSAAAVNAGKNVIVEKPAWSSVKEKNQLLDLLSRRSDVYFFEAARHVHEENFEIVRREVAKLETFQGATLTYQKYSSRYDAFLEGKEPNVFSTRFAGGALQDLGIYLVYCAVSWFGMPDDARYFPVRLRNGIDGSGIAILKYGDENVVLKVGKTSNSYLPGEIYGLRETLLLCGNAADLDQVFLVDAKGNRKLLSNTPDENPMLAEALDFARILEDGSLEGKMTEQAWLDLADRVNQVMEMLKKSAGITY